jgi:hypothetical protein
MTTTTIATRADLGSGYRIVVVVSADITRPDSPRHECGHHITSAPTRDTESHAQADPTQPRRENIVHGTSIPIG